jgi:hypothetical protein
MIPDNTDIVLLRRAIANPGAHQREIYRPLLQKGRADISLSRAIKCLGACGYLRLDKNPDTVQVWPTEKAKRFIAKLDKGEAA